MIEMAWSWSTLCLMLTGGFVLALGGALWRGDGTAALAMGLGGLLAGHAAKLPVPVLAWACAIMAAAFLASLTALIVGAVAGAGRSIYRTGIVGTAAVLLGAMPAGASASRADMARAPVLGAALSSRISTLIPR